ncbi:MAG: PD40 domain-containing protein [Acidobacteria bacterium]|nr:PD40 domain-containing protein [Acidobacteriota bacterium]
MPTSALIRLTSAVIVALAVALPAAADPIKFARYPHVAHGKLVFSYHGDIWVANQDGSSPSRLTAHVGRDAFPRFSPDGKLIAFTSNRFGNDDVFVIPVTGGEPRQLTFNTTGDAVQNWTPDGKGIIFATQRAISPWRSPLYVVSVDGGLPRPMDMDTANSGMVKQDGSMVAFTRKGGAYWRKGNKGNRTDDIWVQDLGTKKITRLTDLDTKQFRTWVHDTHPMWGADGQIYFASERDDIFNVWRIAATGGLPSQVTRHRQDGIQFPSISPDGKVIAYENEFELWTLDVPNGTPKKVTIDMAFDPKDNLVTWVNTHNKAEGVSPSPEGDYVAVDFRGEIFIVPTDGEVGEKTQVSNSSWRDQGATFSPDGRYLAYVSDETREQEVWVFDRTTSARRKVSIHASFKDSTTWSPDSKKLAYVAANRLFLVDPDGSNSTELAYNEAGGYQVSGFSPDSKWLVFTRRDDDQNADVYLFELATKKEHNVTANPFNDSRATITPDGKAVVFISDRDGGMAHLFSVPLDKQREDPNDPIVRERLKKATPPRPERPQGQAGAPAAAPTATPAAAPAPSPLSVNTTRIGRRAVQLTTGEQAVQAYFLSLDGKTVFFRSTDERGPGLFTITIEGKDRRRISDGPFQGLTPTRDRKKVFYTQNQDVYQMELTGERRKTQVNFAFSVKVDQRAEWAQILDESWRVMKYRFYDEKMHGRDWNAMRAKYEPLLKYVGENQDVYDLANEMIGELNASHTGVSGPASREIDNAYQTRYPGFELEPSNGFYRVSHIYRDGPADREWLDLKVGDYVLAIDGKPLKGDENYWSLLNSPLNEYVTVTAASAPTGAPGRKLRIATMTSLANVKYEEWVETNRAMVDRETNGQIAYVHIRSMNQPSLRRFQNEVDQFSNKKGIIVDIRFNGGGNIDQEIIDILERRPYEYWNNRWGSRAWGRRPRQAVAGPKIMMINSRSGSDSEVTPMAFRQLGLGRIVGNPTAAAVIATGSYRLINGGTVRTPGSLVVTYDPTKPNNYGINLENYGVAPDVWVENTPEDELKGFDRELKGAIDEAMKMLKDGKYQYTTEQGGVK